MKKTLILSIFLIAILISGCKQNTVSKSSVILDDRIKALGTPMYKEVEAKGFRILPFPGLSYNGIRDGKQAFYAANKDYTFAIYTDLGITESEKSFEAVIDNYKGLYSGYNPSCAEISSEGWITEARAFSCKYYISSINADYKSTVFYRDGDYVETIVAVWGTSLKEYEYVFDAFVAQAVKWD